MWVYVCITQERREQQLVQAKDRELAQAQQQLRQQVSCVCVCKRMCVCVHIVYSVSLS